MSHQKFTRYLVLAIGLLTIGCSANDGAFKKAIAKARSSSLSEVNEASRGIPFFSIKTLTPNWNKEDNIVKIPGLQLVDQDGKTRSEELFKGKTTFVAFFFASCTGFCPALIQNLKDVEDAVAGFEDMQFVAMTVNPKEDNPSVLKQYAQRLKLAPGKWTLLTGDRNTIYSLAKDTFASEAFKRAQGKSFVHSEHFYLIDAEGRLRSVLNGTRKDAPEKAQRIVSRLKELAS